MNKPQIPTLITASNVNGAFRDAFWVLRTSGIEEASRNGPVLVMPGPVITTFMLPTHRVLFSQVRDANPVFHLVESIWMVAGRNDVEALLPFNSKYGAYAEPDGTIHGAYGHRWRREFGVDQLTAVIGMLQKSSGSRQAVMQMWSCEATGCNDLEGDWKDRPCNTHIYFDCRHGQVNMTVCCRSNDVVWGAYGANVVHFSFLQELIAAALKLPVGMYYQVSNNFHVYTDLPMVKKLLLHPTFDNEDAYNDVRHAMVEPLVQPHEHWEQFVEDCENFCENQPTKTAFFKNVAQPLRAAYINRKAGVEWGHFMPLMPKNNDWKLAFNDWTARRETA